VKAAVQKFRIPLVLPIVLSAVVLMGTLCEKLPRDNTPPNTFFNPGFEPPDTLVTDNWIFRWYGTDLDSDLGYYQYRMLINEDCDSTAIMGTETPWTTVNLDENRLSYSFADPVTNPDGPYVFQARTIDEFDAVDPTPLTRCFRVQIQLPPVVIFTDTPPSRQGLPSAHFEYEASKYDRSGDPITGRNFEYSYQFTRLEPAPPQIITPFAITGWSPQAMTDVSGLTPGFSYRFQVKARDKEYPDIESDVLLFDFQN
jgi:hypothetical protein